jgi:hypothetical protein
VISVTAPADSVSRFPMAFWTSEWMVASLLLPTRFRWRLATPRPNESEAWTPRPRTQQFAALPDLDLETRFRAPLLVGEKGLAWTTAPVPKRHFSDWVGRRCDHCCFTVESPNGSPGTRSTSPVRRHTARFNRRSVCGLVEPECKQEPRPLFRHLD